MSLRFFKQLAGQPHAGCRHADAVRADFGAAAHLFGHGKGALEQLVQRGAHGAGVFGGAHRVFHLAQDLRFAQHHGVEAAGHAKGVAGDLVALQRVGMRAQQGGRNAAVVRQPLQRVVQVGVVTGTVDFSAVAGGEQGRLGLACQRGAQAAQSGLDLVQGVGKAPA
jgi:hypothetical protein